MNAATAAHDGQVSRHMPAALLLAAALLMTVQPAGALVVNPFFAGHGTIDANTDLGLFVGYYPANVGFDYGGGNTQIGINLNFGFLDDGGTCSCDRDIGNWLNYDNSVWAPLWNQIDLRLGGQVTYGNPAPDVFAVSWVDVVNASDTTVHNTFQVLLIGASGYHTNAGLAIAPGSVIFAYGDPANPSGTVNLSSSSPAAIGLYVRGSLATLAGFGVGDANGLLSTADVAALRNSGDPFLFNSVGNGFDAPVAFESVAELVPVPATGWLLGPALALLGLRRRPRTA